MTKNWIFQRRVLETFARFAVAICCATNALVVSKASEATEGVKSEPAVSAAAPKIKEPSEKRGFVRHVSPNKRYLIYDDGGVFIAIGQNRFNIADGKHLPQGSSLDKYLRNMSASGQNTLRLWVEGDEDSSRWLETQSGVFNEEQAKRIDEVFDLAARYNIYIILSPWDTWRTVHVLPKTVYFASGDLKTLPDFLTQEKVQVLQQQKWKYMIDRWGPRTNLLAWELVNELDVFKASPEAELAWVEKMGAYVKNNDPQHHLVTISFSGRENEAVWRSPFIDFIGAHYYGGNCARGVGDIGTTMDWLLHKKFGGQWSFGKPVLFTEVGLANGGYEPKWVRNMMWAGLASGAAGAGMRWIDQGQWGECPVDEYRYNAAIRRFANFVDWRGLLQAPLMASRIRPLAKDVRAFGVSTDRCALIWIEGIAQDGRKYSPDLHVDGLSRGNFAVYYFDTETGEVRDRQFLDVTADAIQIRVPEFAETTACYLEKVESTPATPAPRASVDSSKQPSTSATGRIRCMQLKQPPKSTDAATLLLDPLSFAVDASVPAWHTRFATRVSDGIAPENDDDLSARVYTAWDAESFYVLARVRDDILVTNRPADQAYNMDSIEIYFDASNDRTRRTYLPDVNRQVVIVMNTVAGGGPQLFVDGRPIGSASVQVEKDACLVLATIPFKALGFRPQPGKTVGFDIQLNDCDDPNVGRKTALAWAGGDNLSWCDPSVFGELEFVDNSQDKKQEKSATVDVPQEGKQERKQKKSLKGGKGKSEFTP